MAEHHQIAGRLGGLTTVRRYGSSHMSTLSGMRRNRRGGRPTWQQELERDRFYQELKGARGKTPRPLSI